MVAKGPCEGYFAQHTASCLVMAVRSVKRYPKRRMTES